MCAFFSVMIFFLPVIFAEVLPCPNKDLQTIRLGYVSKKYIFGFDGTSGPGYDINQECHWKFVATDPSAKILYNVTNIYVACGDQWSVDSRTVCCTSSLNSPCPAEVIDDGVTASQLVVNFKSDSTKHDKEGFTLQLTVGKDTTTSCSSGLIKRSLSGDKEVLITSPSFPSLYANNLACSFEIEAESGKRVSFKFIFLQFEKSDSDCKRDRIEFMDGQHLAQTPVSPVCGSAAPFEVNKEIESSQRYLSFNFITDSRVRARGFSAVVSQIVDSVWSPWGGWTTCSKTCGGGTRTRTRTCSNPPPSNGGTTCSGSSSGSEQCNTQNCPVDGVWSLWGGWTVCTKSCGGGTRTGTRTCSNPPPSNGGAACAGLSSASESCNNQNCPVDGVWTLWGGWTMCSKSCDGGRRTRTRTCSNPSPANGGEPCAGLPSESELCNIHSCPSTVATTAATATVATTTTTATVATTKPTTTTPPATAPSPSLQFVIFAVPFWLANLFLLSIIYQLFW